MSGVSGAGDGSMQAGWDQVEGIEKNSKMGQEQAKRVAKASSELEAAKNVAKLAKNAVANAGTLV